MEPENEISVEYHTKKQVIEQIKLQTTLMYRARMNPHGYADANRYQQNLEDLQNILEETNWENDWAVDCDQLFV